MNEHDAKKIVEKLNQLTPLKPELEALGAKVTISIMTAGRTAIPDRAYDFRHEGKCTNCRERTMISFVVRGFEKRNNGTERCELHCLICGYLNDGERERGGDEPA